MSTASSRIAKRARKRPILTLLVVGLVLVALPLSIPLIENLTPHYRQQLPLPRQTSRQVFVVPIGVAVEFHRQRILHVGEATPLAITLLTEAPGTKNPQGWSELDQLDCQLFFDKSAFEVVEVTPAAAMARFGGDVNAKPAVKSWCRWLVVPLKSGTQTVAYNAAVSKRDDK